MASVQKIKLSPSRDIPCNRLVLSQSNVRRVKAGVSIEQLAESIAQRRLSQSLSVRAVIDAHGRETGIFEVPAGGRRYRAMELLVKQKRMAKTQPVPCVTRDGRAAVQISARSPMLDDGEVERRVRLIRPMEHSTIPLAMLPQTHWREADRDTHARAWEAEVAEVPEFTDSEIHIVANLLLPMWKRLPNESTRVYRPQTDTGERIIGRKVSPAWVAGALEGGMSRLSPDAAFAALIEGKTIFDLYEGLQLRCARVMGTNRIELTGFSEPMRDRPRAYGLFGEIISWKLRFFVPVDATGLTILAKVLACYPIARVTDRAAA